MIRKIASFINDVKSELKKVGWSNKKELTNSTSIVIITTLLLALIVTIADWFFSQIIRLIVR
jgi:preprotein translocase SecE subunit